MENNLAPLFLNRYKKALGMKNSYIQKCNGVWSTLHSPVSKQAGILDAYAPPNSGIMKRHEREATGH